MRKQLLVICHDRYPLAPGQQGRESLAPGSLILDCNNRWDGVLQRKDFVATLASKMALGI
jgi:hypothetical protein